MTLNTCIHSVIGSVVPVAGDDVDTDRIMPARYLRCITFQNLGLYPFQDERFTPEGKLKDHPFNDLRHRGASVLVVNKNFGCGSSREHAPQGIFRWGIKAVVGESFSEIFAGNCTAIGLPTVTASEKDVKDLQVFARENSQEKITVDLEKKRLSYSGKEISVDMGESSRKMFLEGTWDSTATLLAALDQVRQTADALPYMGWRKA